MVRHRLSTPPDDPSYTDVAGEDVVKQQILDPDPERHADRTHCGRCGKPLEATLLCAACGDADDEEQAA